MMKGRINSRTQSAFTIVELLVVIVVIAILAAITIVSYTGITGKAVASGLQSDLDNNSKLLKMYYTDHGVYPTGLDGSLCPTGGPPTPDTRYCLKTSNGNTLEYFYALNSDNKYLLVASKDTTKYYITQNTSPNTGGRNLLYLMTNDNASFEDGGVGSWWYPGSSVANSTAWSWHGSKSLRITGDGSPGDWSRLDVTSITSPGSTYTIRCRMKSVVGSNYFYLYDNVSGGTLGTGLTAGNEGFVQATKTFDPTSINRQIFFWTDVGNNDFYVDAVQLESGSTATPF